MNDNNNNKKTENDLAIADRINEKQINQKIKKYEDLDEFITLLYRVADFKPMEEWIHPILNSIECADLKIQLLAAIEDYETQQER